MENKAVARELELAHDVLTALVNIVRNWSSTAIEGSVAENAGVSIPDSEIRVVYLIGSHLGALRPSDMAEQLGVSRSSLTKSLNRLRDEGLIAGETDPCDRRAVNVTLTAEGRAAYEMLIKAGIDLVRGVGGEFSADQFEAVAQFLGSLVARLDSTPIDLPSTAR